MVAVVFEIPWLYLRHATKTLFFCRVRVMDEAEIGTLRERTSPRGTPKQLGQKVQKVRCSAGGGWSWVARFD